MSKKCQFPNEALIGSGIHNKSIVHQEIYKPSFNGI
jgi:hypothetical protein